jgi:hypothetical protein
MTGAQTRVSVPHWTARVAEALPNPQKDLAERSLNPQNDVAQTLLSVLGFFR